MTPPVPTRDTPDGRTYNDLRNLARRHGREPVEYFTLYALEGFLARLAVSEHAEDFVLKGGVLMAAFAARRPTRDIDLAASGFANDVSEVERRMRAVTEQNLGDGLVYESESVVGEPIRDEADYSGVRVKIVAHLASAKIALHVDVNFGDPIWPAPTEAELPLLLGGSIRLRGYPDFSPRRSSRPSIAATRTPAGATSLTSQPSPSTSPPLSRPAWRAGGCRELSPGCARAARAAAHANARPRPAQVGCLASQAAAGVIEARAIP